MGKWFKRVILIALFVLSGFFTGQILHNISHSFHLIMKPSTTALPLLLWLFISIVITLVFAGLVVVLVKPVWLDYVAFIVFTIALLLGWQKYSWITLVAGVITLASSAYFVFTAISGFQQQIKFTLHPIKEYQGLFIFALVFLVSVSVYLGGVDYFQQQGFHLPEPLISITENIIKQQMAGNFPGETSAKEQTQADQEIQKAISGFENTLKPIAPYIAIAIAVLLFLSLSTIMKLLSFIPVLLTGGILHLMKPLKIIRIEHETMEIEKIILNE